MKAKILKLFKLIDKQNIDISQGLTRGIILEHKIEDLLEKIGFKNLTEQYNIFKKADRQKTIRCPNFYKMKTLIRNKDNAKHIYLEDWMPILKNNSFISQPLGTSAAPDIIVIENNKMILIEIKSSRNQGFKKMPRWSSTQPKENVIYIYGINNVNITYFKGEDILSPKISYLFNDFYKNYLDIELVFKKYLKRNGIEDWKNMLGFSPELICKVREKKRNATNPERGYFSHPWKDQRKSNVKEWLKEILYGGKYE